MNAPQHNPPIPTKTVLLTTSEAADYIGVHHQTISTWARQGRLAHLVTPGGQRRFRIKDLDAALARWSR